MTTKLLASLSNWIGPGTPVEVIVLSLPGAVVRSVAATLVKLIYFLLKLQYFEESNTLFSQIPLKQAQKLVRILIVVFRIHKIYKTL